MLFIIYTTPYNINTLYNLVFGPRLCGACQEEGGLVGPADARLLYASTMNEGSMPGSFGKLLLYLVGVRMIILERFYCIILACIQFFPKPGSDKRVVV